MLKLVDGRPYRLPFVTKCSAVPTELLVGDTCGAAQADSLPALPMPEMLPGTHRQRRDGRRDALRISSEQEHERISCGRPLGLVVPSSLVMVFTSPPWVPSLPYGQSARRPSQLTCSQQCSDPGLFVNCSVHAARRPSSRVSRTAPSSFYLRAHRRIL